MRRILSSPTFPSNITGPSNVSKCSYNRIRAENSFSPRSTVVDTCRKKAIRGQEKPNIINDALLNPVSHKLGQETPRKHLEEFGLCKWRKIEGLQLDRERRTLTPCIGTLPA
jgi:hypothetical protein